MYLHQPFTKPAAVQCIRMVGNCSNAYMTTRDLLSSELCVIYYWLAPGPVQRYGVWVDTALRGVLCCYPPSK